MQPRQFPRSEEEERKIFEYIPKDASPQVLYRKPVNIHTPDGFPALLLLPFKADEVYFITMA
jgi:hypothetical protein